MPPPLQAQLTYEGYEVPNSMTPTACLRYLLSFARQVRRDRQKRGGNCMCQHIKGSFLHSFPKPLSLAFVCFVKGRMELIVIMSKVPSPLQMVDNGPTSHGFSRDPGKCPVRGLDIPQGPEENRGTFSLYPGYAGLPLSTTDFQCPPTQKTWDIGKTVFQCPPLLQKTWDIGSTVFQCPPLFAPMSHVL